jgi:hypothetical protein
VHAETKKIGVWQVNVDLDRFSDRINLVASTLNANGFLAIRCLDGIRSIAVAEARKKYQEGDVFDVQLRVDRQSVLQTTGTVIGDTFIEMANPPSDFMKQIMDGRELALRISGQSIITLVFKLAGASQIVPPLLKACPYNIVPDNNDNLF